MGVFDWLIKPKKKKQAKKKISEALIDESKKYKEEAREATRDLLKAFEKKQIA